MSISSPESKSAKIRATLDHPVIDGDGHWLEPVPIFLDYLKTAGGPSVVERYLEKAKESGWYQKTPQERMDGRMKRPTWWGEPANTLDRATAMIPRLFNERLQEMGTDFALVYTSLGLFHVGNPDDELRQCISRAVNLMNSEVFAPYAKTMSPAAVVPMHTPDEAIAEAEFAVKELGMKAIMIANHVRRPIASLAKGAADPSKVPQYVDPLGLDSAHDYDPFWRKCVELKVAVTAHSGSMGWGHRTSVNNFTYNHIGHFGTASHAFVKALVLGGVTKRFPTLNFAFLEGGVGWACNLLTDMIDHWSKRNGKAMEENVRPTNLDTARLKALFSEYGGESYQGKMDELMNCISLVDPFKSLEELTTREYSENLDDFSEADISSPADLRRQFKERFFFGCEADDIMTPMAFAKHGKHRLNPVYSSDVGHFDVTDMSEVLEEAHELVDDGLIDRDDFREFTFTNSARLHCDMNPDFFKGTVVEDAVAKWLPDIARGPAGGDDD